MSTRWGVFWSFRVDQICPLLVRLLFTSVKSDTGWGPWNDSKIKWTQLVSSLVPTIQIRSSETWQQLRKGQWLGSGHSPNRLALGSDQLRSLVIDLARTPSPNAESGWLLCPELTCGNSLTNHNSAFAAYSSRYVSPYHSLCTSILPEAMTYQALVSEVKCTWSMSERNEDLV